MLHLVLFVIVELILLSATVVLVLAIFKDKDIYMIPIYAAVLCVFKISMQIAYVFLWSHCI